MNLETAVKNLTAHGFSVRVFRTAQDAANAISQELSGKTVGFGGSVTLEQMQLFETLQKNNTVYWHWKQTPAQALENARSAQGVLRCRRRAFKGAAMLLARSMAEARSGASLLTPATM